MKRWCERSDGRAMKPIRERAKRGRGRNFARPSESTRTIPATRSGPGHRIPRCDSASEDVTDERRSARTRLLDQRIQPHEDPVGVEWFTPDRRPTMPWEIRRDHTAVVEETRNHPGPPLGELTRPVEHHERWAVPGFEGRGGDPGDVGLPPDDGHPGQDLIPCRTPLDASGRVLRAGHDILRCDHFPCRRIVTRMAPDPLRANQPISV